MIYRYYFDGLLVAKIEKGKNKKVKTYNINYFAEKDDTVYLVLTNKNNKMVLKKVGIVTDMPYVRFENSHPLNKVVKKVVKYFSGDEGVILQMISFLNRKHLKAVLKYMLNSGVFNDEKFENRYGGFPSDYLCYLSYHFKGKNIVD